MGIGRATGKNRAREAAAAAISSPLLDLGIDRATGIVWNITGSKDLTLHEVNEAAEVIYELVDPSALIIFGAVVNPSIKLAEGEVAITLIATGFQPSANPQAGMQPGMQRGQQQQAPPPQQGGDQQIMGWGAEQGGPPPPPPRGGGGGGIPNSQEAHGSLSVRPIRSATPFHGRQRGEMRRVIWTRAIRDGKFSLARRLKKKPTGNRDIFRSSNSSLRARGITLSPRLAAFFSSLLVLDVLPDEDGALRPHGDDLVSVRRELHLVHGARVPLPDGEALPLVVPPHLHVLVPAAR